MESEEARKYSTAHLSVRSQDRGRTLTWAGDIRRFGRRNEKDPKRSAKIDVKSCLAVYFSALEELAGRLKRAKLERLSKLRDCSLDSILKHSYKDPTAMFK